MSHSAALGDMSGCKQTAIWGHISNTQYAIAWLLFCVSRQGKHTVIIVLCLSQLTLSTCISNCCIYFVIVMSLILLAFFVMDLLCKNSYCNIFLFYFIFFRRNIFKCHSWPILTVVVTDFFIMINVGSVFCQKEAPNSKNTLYHLQFLK